MFPNYEQTMWGPQDDNPDTPRKRLQPGDRLADGTIFAGDDEAGRIEAELKALHKAMEPLERRRNKLLQRLTQLDPEKYGPFLEGEIGHLDASITLNKFSPTGEFNLPLAEMEPKIEETWPPYGFSPLPFSDAPEIEPVEPPAELLLDESPAETQPSYPPTIPLEPPAAGEVKPRSKTVRGKPGVKS